MLLFSFLSLAFISRQIYFNHSKRSISLSFQFWCCSLFKWRMFFSPFFLLKYNISLLYLFLLILRPMLPVYPLIPSPSPPFFFPLIPSFFRYSPSPLPHLSLEILGLPSRFPRNIECLFTREFPSVFQLSYRLFK